MVRGTNQLICITPRMRNPRLTDLPPTDFAVYDTAAQMLYRKRQFVRCHSLSGITRRKNRFQTMLFASFKASIRYDRTALNAEIEEVDDPAEIG